ncbi:MAG: tetratricopeptide repeat protein [Verrucomicrobiales bacterium]
MSSRSTIALLASLLVTTSAASAQITVTLRDGTTVRATGLTAQGTRLSLTPEGGGAPRVVEAATVERVDMLQPAVLTETYAAFASGDNVRTLQAMGKLRVELEPLKSIAGGREWWLEGEFLRAHILISQRRIKEMEEAMKVIAADATDPVAQRHAQAFLAHAVGLAGDPRKALEQLRPIILNARDPETLADAWLFTGIHRTAVNEQQDALVAFLRVPVFYPALAIPLAGSRLGAARCLVALEDRAGARRILKELVASEPNSQTGAEGKKLLSQVEKDLGISSTATDASQ